MDARWKIAVAASEPMAETTVVDALRDADEATKEGKA